MQAFRNSVRMLTVGVACLGLAWGVGCEREERVLDVDTPGGGVQINRTGDDVNIKLRDDEGQSKEIHIDVEDK